MENNEWNKLMIHLAKMDGPTVTKWYFNVGRNRKDLSFQQMWIVADHILCLAALDARIKTKGHEQVENEK